MKFWATAILAMSVLSRGASRVRCSSALGTPRREKPAWLAQGEFPGPDSSAPGAGRAYTLAVKEPLTWEAQESEGARGDFRGD